jgi:hypothetical protein
MLHRHPELYGGFENMRILFSYMDDFIGGTNPRLKSIRKSLNNAALQMSTLKELGR